MGLLVACPSACITMEAEILMRLEHFLTVAHVCAFAIDSRYSL